MEKKREITLKYKFMIYYGTFIGTFLVYNKYDLDKELYERLKNRIQKFYSLV